MKTPPFHRAAARLSLWTGLCLGSVIAASGVPVTFRVNMEFQIAQGSFNPSAGHGVEVHGSFDGWGAGFALSASAADPNLYEATREIPGSAGSEVQYKFVINQSGTQVWENNGVGPGGAQNRALTLLAAAQTLPVVHFNNEAAPPGDVAVTFQVDLSVQETLGHFNPGAGHSVEARGSFDNWGAGIALAVDPNTPGLYQGTVTIRGSAGAAFEHKFVINQAGPLVWEGNVGPGGPNGNRTFNLGASPQILPVVYFNNLTNDPGAGIAVTFRVNLGVQIARGRFDPVSGTVVVAGPFNSWSTTANPLTNSLDQPTLYTGIVNISTESPGASVPHKFVLNGGTWEGGDNRLFVLNSSSQTLPAVPFDRLGDLGPISVLVDTFGVFVVTASWEAGPGIRLQKSTDAGGAWEEIPGSLGANSATFDLSFDEERPPTLFRLTGP